MGRKGRKGRATSKVEGDARAAFGRSAEDQALALLEPRGLTLLERNYQVARGPSRRGGEIDMILRDRDGTLVFVEVRARRAGAWVSAAETVDARKRQRIRYAALCYLASLPHVPPCRFDVVTLDGTRIDWLQGAFGAD
ncbi:MAG TPA: YraN family protein [Burkholderiaceae bacterium]|jgi:putative endonuclease|nr:YraN family protein [Burkholderiaceae bacterium]